MTVEWLRFMRRPIAAQEYPAKAQTYITAWRASTMSCSRDLPITSLMSISYALQICVAICMMDNLVPTHFSVVLISIRSTFKFHNCPANYFRDLRDDRVSQALETVHPSGNPISHSTHVGFNAPPT